ncbi:TNF receptor-associated factor 3-like isoform X2 [Crassostrea angulata]|uniref:TNF receptor-associated factor 3-like isoform X2 n=1 Tax=Magallana angulata TaxID=2784310 RepID=UPI0022B199E3|nr:TNF receptor-associated factor 3-like isoform X2 [Crassostrea angulata]
MSLMAEGTQSSPSSLSSNPQSTRLPIHQTPAGNPEFITVDDKYRCVVCNGIVREAVQTQCGHRGCEQCFSQLLQGNPKQVMCPAGEESCVYLKENEIFRDFGARREVRLLPVYCSYKTEGCKEEVPWKNLQDHLETACLEYDISCPFRCGVESATRRMMIQHYTNECPRRPIECKYNSIGCKFTGSKEDVDNHIRNELDHHLELSVRRSAETGLKGAQAKERTQELYGQVAEVQQLIAGHVKIMHEAKENIESLKKNIKDVKLKVVAQTERLITVERKIDKLADQETQNRLAGEMHILKENQSSIETRVTQLERAGPVGGQNGIPSDQIQLHERQLGIIDLRLAELDLRFQVMETASYNGVLMWKIRDYSRRKQDAKSGRTISLYSQPFYTGRFGYKMCARVYLNGDGVGKGTHLSLFFVVQRGEYDALLPWPFKQKVSLMLLDQDNGTRHLVDSFRPDITSSSFKRPTSEMNVASGCPLFVSHSVLETPTFLQEDTIYIKVVVDIEGLRQH